MHIVQSQESNSNEIGHITQEIEDDFEALVSGKHDNFELVSCFINGEPTAAIVLVEKQGHTSIETALYVAITPNMVLTDHDGNKLEHNEPEPEPDDDDEEEEENDEDEDEPEDQDN